MEFDRKKMWTIYPLFRPQGKQHGRIYPSTACGKDEKCVSCKYKLLAYLVCGTRRRGREWWRRRRWPEPSTRRWGTSRRYTEECRSGWPRRCSTVKQQHIIRTEVGPLGKAEVLNYDAYDSSCRRVWLILERLRSQRRGKEAWWDWGWKRRMENKEYNDPKRNCLIQFSKKILPKGFN